jgi:hypothetical protein
VVAETGNELPYYEPKPFSGELETGNELPYYEPKPFSGEL